MNCSNILKSNVKFFLSSIFVLIACMSLAAKTVECSVIYIAENAKVYGKELLIVKQNTNYHSNRSEGISRVAKKEVANKNSGVIKTSEKSITVVPAFPFLPFYYYYLQSGRDLEILVLRKRSSEHQQEICYRNIKNTYLHIKKSSNLYLILPILMQKFSTTLTQCGMLTSFSPNSPSVI